MKIGLVISGGDASGINNFIFQIAKFTGADMVLFNGGITGLINNSHREVSYRELLDFAISSMPVITAGRTESVPNHEQYQSIAKNLKSKHIKLLIMAGGDGSLKFLNILSTYGVNCFGVAMTIDNNVSGSEYSIGFSTACEQVIQEVSKLRNTGRALPHRVFLVELLGANCGELTLQSAIKSNADFALIPEHQIPLTQLAARITTKLDTQNSVVMLCSEAYTHEYTPGYQGAIHTLAAQLEPLIGVRIRKAMIGFSLRSGEPTTEEIYQGTIMANEVARCIKSGMQNKVVVINANNKAIPIDLTSMESRTVDCDGHYFKLAKQLGMI